MQWTTRAVSRIVSRSRLAPRVGADSRSESTTRRRSLRQPRNRSNRIDSWPSAAPFGVEDRPTTKELPVSALRLLQPRLPLVQQPADVAEAEVEVRQVVPQLDRLRQV